MKQKMSMSFLLLSIASVWGLPTLWGTLKGALPMFAAFSGIGFVQWLLSLVTRLAPCVLVLLLYLNTKRDVKQWATLTLLIYGIARLVAPVTAVTNVVNEFNNDWAVGTLLLITTITGILMGAIALLGSSCIRKQQKNRWMVVLTCVAFYINIVPLVVSLVVETSYSAYQLASPFLLSAGVCLFPVTVFDYDHCVAVTKKTIKLPVIIAVVLAVILIINNAGGGNDAPTCAKAGCDNPAVTSGDSVYCATHSNLCQSCGCYIDGDAAFCMDCIEDAINK